MLYSARQLNGCIPRRVRLRLGPLAPTESSVSTFHRSAPSSFIYSTTLTFELPKRCFCSSVRKSSTDQHVKHLPPRPKKRNPDAPRDTLHPYVTLSAFTDTYANSPRVSLPVETHYLNSLLSEQLSATPTSIARDSPPTLPKSRPSSSSVKKPNQASRLVSEPISNYSNSKRIPAIKSPVLASNSSIIKSADRKSSSFRLSQKNFNISDYKALLSKMLAAEDNAIVQAEGCAALGTYFSTQDSKISIPDSELLSTIIVLLKALKVHGQSKNWSMIVNACEILNAIVQHSQSSQLFAAVVPELKTIAELMEEFPNDIFIQWNLCALLYRISYRNSEVQTKLLELGMERRVVETLDKFITDIEVLTNACGLFDNLSVRYELMGESTISSAIEILLKILHDYPQNIELQNSVLAGLSNLARYSPHFQKLLASKDTLTLFLDIVKRYTDLISTDETAQHTVRNALRCVINVIQGNPANTDIVCGLDLNGALQNAFQHHLFTAIQVPISRIYTIIVKAHEDQPNSNPHLETIPFSLLAKRIERFCNHQEFVNNASTVIFYMCKDNEKHAKEVLENNVLQGLWQGLKAHSTSVPANRNILRLISVLLPFSDITNPPQQMRAITENLLKLIIFADKHVYSDALCRMFAMRIMSLLSMKNPHYSTFIGNNTGLHSAISAIRWSNSITPATEADIDVINHACTLILRICRSQTSLQEKLAKLGFGTLITAMEQNKHIVDIQRVCSHILADWEFSHSDTLTIPATMRAITAVSATTQTYKDTPYVVKRSFRAFENLVVLSSGAYQKRKDYHAIVIEGTITILQAMQHLTTNPSILRQGCVALSTIIIGDDKIRMKLSSESVIKFINEIKQDHPNDSTIQLHAQRIVDMLGNCGNE